MRTVWSAMSLTAAILAAGLAVRAQSQASNDVSGSIRSVDFRNFTYKPSCISSRVTAQNGEYDNPYDSQEDGPVRFAITKVMYGDLRGDGSEQAVVVADCNLGGTGYWIDAFVFDMRAGKPVEVDRLAGGDRAIGGIKDVRIEGHVLKVTQQYGVSACCAVYVEHTSCVLGENRLVPVENPKRVGADSGKPIRALRFTKGSSSGRISGETGGDTIYEFRARAGQVLVAERLPAMKTTNDVGLGIMGPDGMMLRQDSNAKVSTAKLPSDGVYTLVIFSSQPNVPYEFNLTIR